MVEQTLIYLDSLPITESNLALSASAEANVDYKSQLNLAFNINNAHIRLTELVKLIQMDMSEGQVTAASLNLVLESYLITLLVVTTLSNLQKTELTPHYCSYKREYTRAVPDLEQLKTMLFANQKRWGTAYGSLGYFINLNLEFEEYLSPSQIVDRAVRRLIQAAKDVQIGSLLLESTPVATELYDLLVEFEAAHDSSTVEADSALYAIPALTISIKDIYQVLLFLEQFLPAVMQWYFSDYIEDNQPAPPVAPVIADDPNSNQELQAYYLLLNLAQQVAAYGFNIKNAAYDFIHQQTSPALLTLVTSVLTYRCELVLKDVKLEVRSDSGPLVVLMSQFLYSEPLLKLSNTPTLVTTVSRSLISMTPPGGYNLLLVAVAATLVNRAYILTHPANFGEDQYLHQLSGTSTQTITRVLRLLVLAGQSLRKSTLTHLQTIGTNLVGLSQLNPVGLDPKDLLDLN